MTKKIVGQLERRLLAARHEYSQVAKILEERIAVGGLTEELSEQIIGVGVAADWLARAARLESIHFVGRTLNRPERRHSFEAISRFTYTWFAANAVFSRSSLIKFFGLINVSEFVNFSHMYNASPINDSHGRLSELHGILSQTTVTRIAGHPKGSRVSTLHAIYIKYLQHSSTKGAVAKQVKKAAIEGSISSLHVPSLIYAFRNWAVHGAALDGSFGTRPGFMRYVSVLLECMADIHHNAAVKLRADI